MKKLNSRLDTFQNAISGGVWGNLSITAGILGDIIALILFPGYDFMKRPVSSLCKGPGGIFFQLGIILSGLFAVFFVLYVVRTFDDTNISKNIKKWALSFALISCVSFINLGVFCGSNPIVSLIHGASAVVSWISAICYIGIFSFLMMKDSKYSKLPAYIGFSVSSSLSLMILLFILYYIPGIQGVVNFLPLLEWYNTFALTFWYFVASTYILVKKI